MRQRSDGHHLRPGSFNRLAAVIAIATILVSHLAGDQRRGRPFGLLIR